MNFKKLSIILILSLFIFANVYANTRHTENKFNPQYNLNSQLVPKSITNYNNDCESNTFDPTNPIKHVHCSKLNHHKFVQVIVPAVISWGVKEAVKKSVPTIVAGLSSVLTGDTKKDCGPCVQGTTVAERGTKVNWRLDDPGGHSHYDCPKEAGHWHWEKLNQNPKTCRCYANPSGKFYSCGTAKPAEHNTIIWYNDYVY